MVQIAPIPSPDQLSALRARRRDELFEHAVDLIRERGFDACSVDDIAAHAGISRRSFFNYFPTKNALLVHLHQEITRRVLAALAAEEGAPLARVRSALLQFAPELERDHLLLRALFTRVYAEADLRDQDAADSSSALPQFVAAIEQAQASGSLPTSIDPDDAVRFLFSVVNGALANWALQAEPRPATLHDLLSQRIDWAMSGLAATTTP